MEEEAFPVICIKPDIDAREPDSGEAQESAKGNLQIQHQDDTVTSHIHQATVKAEPDADDDVRANTNTAETVTWIPQPTAEPSTPITWVAQSTMLNDKPKNIFLQNRDTAKSEIEEITSEVAGAQRNKHMDNTSTDADAKNVEVKHDIEQSMDCSKLDTINDSRNVTAAERSQVVPNAGVNQPEQYSDVNVQSFSHHKQATCLPRDKGLPLKQVYMCKSCRKCFIAARNLEKHIRIYQHFDDRPYQCKVCGISFAGVDQLTAHIAGHDREIDVDKVRTKTEQASVAMNKAEDCGMRISDVRSCAEEHADDTAHLMQPGTSQECTLKKTLEVKGSGAQDIHFCESNQKRKRPQPTPVQQCRVCDKYYKSPSHLKEHMRMHTRSKSYQCSVCDKAFNLNHNLTRHMRIHKKPYECTVCGKSFAESGNLTVHTRFHTGEKPYECTVCGKSFASSNCLTVHARCHTGEKPYQCSVCDKSFAGKTNLTTHARVHNGERPYECSLCGKSFRQSCHLTSHKRTHECAVCGKCVTRSCNLLSHRKQHAE